MSNTSSTAQNGTAGEKTREKAIVVGVIQAGEKRWDIEDSLTELELLADTAGADVDERFLQNVSQINAATYIGKGKVTEIKQKVGDYSTDLVIFDDELSPVQLRNLERSFGCKVLDRSALILDIFAQHARTATAKTQVELAQLEYLRTRLTRQWTHLSRQKGGIGTKGPGETQIETDRRLIGQRISTLKERLVKIDRQRTSQRKGRQAFTRVSLVGYTNAGKSTFMNAVAGESVRAENRLFATLDSTTRTVFLEPGRQILMSDTVGFIKKLPHRLIESFKSTLDEVRESDILLHVVDATHERFAEHIEVVQSTLGELGADDKPTLLVFNKIDAFKEKGAIGALRQEYPGAAFVSAMRGIGLAECTDRLLELIESDFEEQTICLPIEEQRTIAHIRNIGEVISEEYLKGTVDFEGGVRDVVRLRFRTAPRYHKDVEPLVAKYQHFRPIDGAGSNGVPDARSNGSPGGHSEKE